MGEKRNGEFRKNSSRGSLDREVNTPGWAGWQGNKISSKKASIGSLEREVNKKCKHLLPHWSNYRPSIQVRYRNGCLNHARCSCYIGPGGRWQGKGRKPVLPFPAHAWHPLTSADFTCDYSPLYNHLIMTPWRVHPSD